MCNMISMTQQQKSPKIIPPHGGYKDLQSYQMSEIVYDGTVVFCDRFISPRSRTHDQMVQAARSGKSRLGRDRRVHGLRHLQKDRAEAHRRGKGEPMLVWRI